MASTTSPRNPEGIRRWVENCRAVAARDRSQTGAGIDAASPVRMALDLIAIARTLQGWPIPRDAVSRREDELRWHYWSRLRETLGEK
jgi:hypothetical protein